ncbi:MAG: PAS domain S-box protein [Chloroflexota bacterium]
MAADILTTRTRKAAQVCAVIVAAISLLASLGWLFGNLQFASLSPAYIPMPPSSALGLVLLACVLIGLARQMPVRWPQARMGIHLLNAAIVLSSLLGMAAGLRNTSGGQGYTWHDYVGVMSPVTGLLLILSASALSGLVQFPAEDSRANRWVAWSGILNLVSGTVLLLWYLYDEPLFYQGRFSPPALTSALAFFAAGIGLCLLVLPRVAWLYFLAGPSLQARLLRAFLPVFIPVILFENIAEKLWLNALYEDHPAWALLTTLVTGAVFSAILWFTAKSTGEGIEAAEVALRVSEQRFRGLLEQSLEGMVLTDESGRITHWNAAQEAISKVPASEAIGRFVWDVQFDVATEEARTPERLQALKKVILQMLEGGQSSRFGQPAELPMLRADGVPIVVQSMVFPISTTKGRILCGTLRDITRRKQAEEALFWELAENAALSTLYKPLIAADATLEDVAHTILEQAQSLTGSEHGYVSVIDPVTKQNVGYTLTAMMDQCTLEGQTQRITFDPDENGHYAGLWGEALNTRQPFYTNDAPAHAAARGIPQGHVPLEQFLSVPVMLVDELVGQIALANPGRDYSEHDLEAAQRLAEYFALAIQRHRIEAALQAEHENLLKIFQAAPVGMLLVDADTSIVEANTALGEMILREPARIIGERGGGGLQCIHSFEDPRGCGFSHSCPACPLRNGVQSVLDAGKSIHGEEICVTLRINNTPTDRWLRISAEPLSINHQPHVIVAIDDVTERKAAEHTLQLSEERYRGLFEHMQEGAALHEIICDPAGKPIDYRFLEVNPAFEKLTGLKAEALIGKTVLGVLPQTERYWIETYGKVALTGKPVMMENYARDLERWYQVSAYSPRAGQFAVMFEEITARKQHEMYVEASLQEKEVLLKEIHHRVKNNLQIITSLLNLYAETIADPMALQAFRDCQNNVRAIALVHEHLYRSEKLAQVEANEYLPNLLKHLYTASSHPTGEIHLHMQIAASKMDLDIAIPCGLIVTELFTNAHKHAFPDNFTPNGHTAEIQVLLEEENGRYHLTVRDNGVGLPAGLDPNTTNSMGLQLVHMLARQLQGQLTVENEKGVVCRVVFPKGFCV